MITVKINDVETPVESLPSDMISTGEQFSEEERTNIAAALAKTLSNPLYRAGVGIEERERLDAMVSGESGAAKRLNARKAQKQPVVLPFEFEGETFWIRRLSYEDLVTVAVSISRDGHNVLNITDEEGAVSAWVAILLHAVVNEDNSPYFEYDDVRDYFSDPDQASLISALNAECVRVNPDLFSTLKKRL